jgi:hypothetical protein
VNGGADHRRCTDPTPFSASAFEREVESDEREESLDARRRIAHDDIRRRAPQGIEQDAESAGIDERHIAQVDHPDRRVAVQHRRDHGGTRHVEFASGTHDAVVAAWSHGAPLTAGPAWLRHVKMLTPPGPTSSPATMRAIPNST